MLNSKFTKYGYIWVTLALFLISLTGHWVFAWTSFVADQQEHGQEIVVSDYISQVMRDTLENWQSEFLQLMWQIAGLSFLYYVGSPQSKEGDDRKEEKLDLILKKLDPSNAEEEIRKLDTKYPKS